MDDGFLIDSLLEGSGSSTSTPSTDFDLFPADGMPASDSSINLGMPNSAAKSAWKKQHTLLFVRPKLPAVGDLVEVRLEPAEENDATTNDSHGKGKDKSTSIQWF